MLTIFLSPKMLAIGTLPESFEQEKIEIEVPVLVLNIDDQNTSAHISYQVMF